MQVLAFVFILLCGTFYAPVTPNCSSMSEVQIVQEGGTVLIVQGKTAVNLHFSEVKLATIRLENATKECLSILSLDNPNTHRVGKVDLPPGDYFFHIDADGILFHLEFSVD